MKEFMKKLLLLLFLCNFCFGATLFYDPSQTGSSHSGAWDDPYSYADFEAYFESGSATSDIIYALSGTTALTSAFTANRNTTATIIGVDSFASGSPTVANWSEGDNRSLFTLGAYQLLFSTYNHNLKNLRFTGSLINFVIRARSGTYINIKSTNTYNDSSANGIEFLDGAVGINCYGISTYGNGIYIDNTCGIFGCTGSDSNVGIHFDDGYSGLVISNLMAFDCTTGIFLHRGFQMLNNSTVDNCTTGIECASKTYQIIANCNITNNTTGIQSLATGTTILGNNFYGNTTRISGSGYYEYSYSELDPQFKDVDNLNFQPQNLNLLSEAYPSTFIGTNTLNTNNAGAMAVQKKSCSTYTGVTD